MVAVDNRHHGQLLRPAFHTRHHGKQEIIENVDGHVCRCSVSNFRCQRRSERPVRVGTFPKRRILVGSHFLACHRSHNLLYYRKDNEELVLKDFCMSDF